MRNAILLLGMLPGVPACLGAEGYPAKPVRVVVAFGTGGATDLTARLVSQQLSEQVGRPFVVDNRPGASGAIGAAIVAKAAPDGYTLFMAEPNFASLPGLAKSLPFDVVRDFTPITQVGRIPNVLVVHPSLNVLALKDFIALARANPGKFNYGTTGTGSSMHLGAELFKKQAKIDLVHVPYKGGGEVINATLTGEVHMRIAPVTTALSHIKTGRLRGLAVTTDGKRVPSLPDVPSMTEEGISDMAVYHWTGLLGPAGLPRAIAVRLHDEVAKAIAAPTVKEWFGTQSGELVGNDPGEFARHVRSEMQRWSAVIKSAGIKID